MEYLTDSDDFRTGIRSGVAGAALALTIFAHSAADVAGGSEFARDYGEEQRLAVTSYESSAPEVVNATASASDVVSLQLFGHFADDEGFSDMLIPTIAPTPIFVGPSSTALGQFAISDREFRVLNQLVNRIALTSAREFVRVTKTSVEVFDDPEDDSREFFVIFQVPLSAYEAMKYWDRIGKEIERMAEDLTAYDQEILAERFGVGVEWDV